MTLAAFALGAALGAVTAWLIVANRVVATATKHVAPYADRATAEVELEVHGRHTYDRVMALADDVADAAIGRPIARHIRNQTRKAH